MNQNGESKSSKGCLGCLGVLFLLFISFPVFTQLRHSILPTNKLTITVLDTAGRPVPGASLRFSRHTSLMMLPILFSDATPLNGTSVVITDGNGSAVFRAGCDDSHLEAVEVKDVAFVIQSARRVSPPTNGDEGMVWWSPWGDSYPSDWKVIVRRKD